MSGLINCPLCQLAVPASQRVCPNDGTDLFFRQGQLLADKYELIDIIGSGGMGVIYKARHLILDKIVAIKVLHNSRADSNLIMRFQREAKAASSLSHINVITIYDFGIIDGVKPYMVMDFLPGRTLADLLNEGGPLAVRQTLEIVEQILSALIHAHKKNILHRDLKPSNIMVIEEEGELPVLKILDFGLAKIVDGDEQVVLSQVGTAMGSPAYMSPEQATGLKVDKRADLYSLGCIAYELLAGKPPLIGESPMETLVNRLNYKAQPLGEVLRTSARSRSYEPGREIPTIVELFVAKLLERDPKDRFQSAQEARSYLDTIWQYVDKQPGQKELGTTSGAWSSPFLGGVSLKSDNPEQTWQLKATESRQAKSPAPGLSQPEKGKTGDTLLEKKDIRDTVKDIAAVGSDDNLSEAEKAKTQKIADPKTKKTPPPDRNEQIRASRKDLARPRLDEQAFADRRKQASAQPRSSRSNPTPNQPAASRPASAPAPASPVPARENAERSAKSKKKSHNQKPAARQVVQPESIDLKVLIMDLRSRNPQLFWLVILMVVAALMLTFFILFF